MGAVESPAPEIAIPDGMEDIIGRVKGAIGRTAMGLIVAYRDSGELDVQRFDTPTRTDCTNDLEYRRVQQERRLGQPNSYRPLAAFPASGLIRTIVDRDYTEDIYHRETRTELNTGTVALQFDAVHGSYSRGGVFEIGISTDAEVAGPTMGDEHAYVLLDYQSVAARAAALGEDVTDLPEVSPAGRLAVASQAGLVIAQSLLELAAEIGVEGLSDDREEMVGLIRELDKTANQGTAQILRPAFVQNWIDAQAA